VDVVSDGRRVLGTAERCGDEPMLLAAHAPGVPVLVGPRRDTVGQRAVAAFGTELLILDDGFQHHRLARDVDLVVFPGAGLGNGSGLPRGPLREPLRTLRRADALLVMDGPLPEADARRLASAAPGLPSYAAFREPAGLRPLAGGPSREVSWLPDQSVGVLSGLARPHALRDSVAALGARVTAERCFPDHHRYREADLRGLAEQAKVWITSEKDAGKILPDWTHGAELWVLTQATRLPEQEAFLDWLQARLRARPAGRNSALEPRAAGGPR
jgi:tetraacyldisaccharide 4'-kinase